MAARAFHDFAGPASALQNGLSFLDQPELFQDVKGHLEESAYSLNLRLEFFRMLMGRRGSSDISWDAIRRVTETYMHASENLTFEWPEQMYPIRKDEDALFVRTVLCLLLLGAEAMPLGGSLRVSEFGDRRLEVTFSGKDLHKSAPLLEMLEEDLSTVSTISARQAAAAWVNLFCKITSCHLMVTHHDDTSDTTTGQRVTVTLVR